MKDDKNVVQFPQSAAKVTTDSYYGGCPSCGACDGYLNVGSNHWFKCDTHKVKWCAGSNLFSGWRSEGPEEWQANEILLAAYQQVDPVMPSFDGKEPA